MNDQYIIRRALPEDVFGIHEAHMKSIQELCSKDYTEAEIKAWGHRPYNEEHRLFAITNHPKSFTNFFKPNLLTFPSPKSKPISFASAYRWS